MSKSKVIEWAKANGQTRVYKHVDGLGRTSYFATNCDRPFVLVWRA